MTVTAETLQLFHDIDADLRPGYSAELVAGVIVVNPPPNGQHETMAWRVALQFATKSAIHVDSLAGRGIQTPLGLYVPDLTVVEYDSANDEMSWGTTAGVQLVAEITSTNAAMDRDAKRRSYAAADIPFYLLVDRRLAELVLFSKPDVEMQDYRSDYRVAFGSDLELPAPFSFTLTSFM